MRTATKFRSFVSTFVRDESGAIAILMSVFLPAFVGFATLAVDASYVYSAHNQLQNAADAAALAGNQYIGAYTGTSSAPCSGSSASPETLATSTALCTYAEKLAAANMPSAQYGSILEGADIIVGTWSSAGTFTALTTGAIPNAVKVTTRMTSANSNPVNLFFTQLLGAISRGAGFKTFSVTASAIAAFTATNACGTGCSNGSGFNAVSDLIIVQDLSSSFSSVLSNAQTAEINCIKDFALSGTANSNLGLTLFTGNSPQKAVTSINGSAVPASDQGGWCPQNWNNSCNSPKGKDSISGITTAEEQNPYAALTSATSTNFQTNMDNSVNAETDCSGSSLPQYGCSGSNIAAGMQSAINQLCPSTGCAGGTVQMLIITDGISNCSTSSSSGSYGTSTILGQNCNATSFPAGTPSWAETPDGQLLADAQNLATYAGNQGITVSTLYYSGESGENGGNATGPDGQTHAAELQNLTTLANNALQNTLGSNAVKGQFFNEPTGSDLTTDMQEICSGGANANRPRLVM
jgi:Flp pilus assembly protein TadG